MTEYGAAAGEFVELHFINAYGMFAAGDNGASSEIKKVLLQQDLCVQR